MNIGHRAAELNLQALVLVVSDMLNQDPDLDLMERFADWGAKEVIELAQVNVDLFRDPSTAATPWVMAVGAFAKFLVQWQRATGYDVLADLRGSLADAS